MSATRPRRVTGAALSPSLRAMIGVDWGTTSLRAYRLAADGQVRDRIQAPDGIQHVRSFPDALSRTIGPWLAEGEDRVLLAGMVGSRQGWTETPALPCPAGPREIAAALVAVPFDRARVLMVPGLCTKDAEGVPEVMRGEETQLLGVDLPDEALVCLPGSHSKWARIGDGRIAAFRTHLTGEAYAALRCHTILGRMMTEGADDLTAFDRGVARAGDGGGLLHHLFGVRTLGLAGALAETGAASYLSGLLIGHEVRAALSAAHRPPRQLVNLIGNPALCALYARAIDACGGMPEVLDTDAAAAARGLHRIGTLATWQ